MSRDAALKERILAAWRELPASSREAPATDAAIARFELAFGDIPAPYRWFLRECGGGTIGGQRLDDVRRLAASQTRFQKEAGPPMGWSMERVFVIGWTGRGPLAIHKPSGRVLEEAPPGSVVEISSSFLSYLASLLETAEGRA